MNLIWGQKHENKIYHISFSYSYLHTYYLFVDLPMESFIFTFLSQFFSLKKISFREYRTKKLICPHSDLVLNRLEGCIRSHTSSKSKLPNWAWLVAHEFKCARINPCSNLGTIFALEWLEPLRMVTSGHKLLCLFSLVCCANITFCVFHVCRIWEALP